MRVVTWNMGCGSNLSGYAKHHDAAWQHLVEELRPDIAFVQEARVKHIDAARTFGSVTVCELGPGATAGAAILVRGLESRPLDGLSIGTSTYLAGVEVETTVGPLAVVNVHVYPGKQQHADLRDLVELLATRFAGKGVLVGGDFNAARSWDEVYGGRRHRDFFDAMAAAGLSDVYFALHQREGRTFWGRHAKNEYHIDHFFAARDWASRVVSCQIEPEAAKRGLSDHAPVVLELDAGERAA